MCGKDKERVNRLFLHCEVAVTVWCNFIGRCGLAWCCLKNIVEAADSWHGGCFVSCGRILWRMIPFAILWSVWKERNDRIFRDYSSTTTEVISKVSLRIAKWALRRKEFSMLS